MLRRVYWISEYSWARIIYLPLVLYRVYWISEYSLARIIYLPLVLRRVYWISEYSWARIIYLPLVLCRVYWISEYSWARIIYRVNLLKLNTEKCSAKTLTKSFKFLECHMILYTWDKLSLIRPFNSSIHLFLILLLIY